MMYDVTLIRTVIWRECHELQMELIRVFSWKMLIEWWEECCLKSIFGSAKLTVSSKKKLSDEIECLLRIEYFMCGYAQHEDPNHTHTHAPEVMSLAASGLRFLNESLPSVEPIPHWVRCLGNDAASNWFDHTDWWITHKCHRAFEMMT